MDAIFQRRSIRDYTDQPVEDEQIEAILRGAMAAPSAGNEQPWHFVVMRDRKRLEAITAFHEYAFMLKQAPVAIAVCGDTAEEKFEGFWVQDCAAATQNMLLAATDLGLGSVWLGIHPVPERIEGLANLLNVPRSVIPFALVALGHPAETREEEDRFKPQRIHQEAW
jgi:nitroreductase